MTVPDKTRRITPAEHLQAQRIAHEQRAAEQRERNAKAREWAAERAKYRIPYDHPAHTYVTKRLGDDVENGYKIAEPWCYKGRVEIHLAAWHAMTNRQPNHVVYYIKVSKYIKIGTTNNLTARINSYPPDSKLLATEPGGYDVEALRHEQFAKHLSARKEWFTPAPEILAHVKGLQRATVEELRRVRGA